MTPADSNVVEEPTDKSAANECVIDVLLYHTSSPMSCAILCELKHRLSAKNWPLQESNTRTVKNGKVLFFFGSSGCLF